MRFRVKIRHRHEGAQKGGGVTPVVVGSFLTFDDYAKMSAKFRVCEYKDRGKAVAANKNFAMLVCNKKVIIVDDLRSTTHVCCCRRLVVEEVVLVLQLAKSKCCGGQATSDLGALTLSGC